MDGAPRGRSFTYLSFVRRFNFFGALVNHTSSAAPSGRGLRWVCNPGLKTWAILLDHSVVNEHLRTHAKPGRTQNNQYKNNGAHLDLRLSQASLFSERAITSLRFSFPTLPCCLLLRCLLFRTRFLCFAGFCPLFIDNARCDLFFPALVSSFLLEFLFDLFVLALSFRTSSSWHIVSSLSRLEVDG
jgi:hypothetical protein